MAEQARRAGRRIWPWALGAAVVAIVLYFVWPVSRTQARDIAQIPPISRADTSAELGGSATPIDADAVADGYLEFANQYRKLHHGAAGRPDMGAGLAQLGPALIAVAGPDTARSPIRAALDSIQRTLDHPITGSAVRASFTSAANAIDWLQRTRQPALAGEVAELRRAAYALRTDRPLPDQTDVATRFFSLSADLLDQIAEGR